MHEKTRTKLGRVENRVTPALPHQTVHTVFPYTAFRYPSSIRHCASTLHWLELDKVHTADIKSQR